MSEKSWQTLGAPAPTKLVDARLQLHHAAQLAAAAGATFLEPRPDDSHPNLGWDDELEALVGRRIPGPPPFQVGIELAERRLLLLDSGRRTSESFDLNGRSLAEAAAWLQGAIARTDVSVPAAGASVPGYELPEHPVAKGAAFCADPDACAELARWFANGEAILSDLSPRLEGASDVRVWPHHFDLATLVVVESEKDGSLAKSIGVGFSPGDDSYPEPYWYVSPWPYPDPAGLPALEGEGFWHDEGYIAAILTGSRIVDGPSISQHQRLQDFLTDAIAASQSVLRG
jgi:hypothetical protein